MAKIKEKYLPCSNHYDPRPSAFAKTTLDDVMVLRDQLQQLRTPVGLLNVLPMTPHHELILFKYMNS